MGHNLVVLDKQINEQNVQAKFLDPASQAASSEYVPAGDKNVLGHTKLLGPGETDSITFNAPYVPGQYLYVCSFPGHYTQGTKGFMPSKGGRVDLSDDEIKGAVDYITGQSR